MSARPDWNNDFGGVRTATRTERTTVDPDLEELRQSWASPTAVPTRLSHAKLEMCGTCGKQFRSALIAKHVESCGQRRYSLDEDELNLMQRKFSRLRTEARETSSPTSSYSPGGGAGGNPFIGRARRTSASARTPDGERSMPRTASGGPDYYKRWQREAQKATDSRSRVDDLRNAEQSQKRREERANEDRERLERERKQREAERQQAQEAKERRDREAKLQEIKARANHERQWEAFEARTTGTITYDQVPWPPYNTNILNISPTATQDVVKAAYRHAFLRWHPDKFLQRYGPRLDAGDRTRIEEKVKSVCQLVSQERDRHAE